MLTFIIEPNQKKLLQQASALAEQVENDKSSKDLEIHLMALAAIRSKLKELETKNCIPSSLPKD